jgi:hypothetical protein
MQPVACPGCLELGCAGLDVQGIHAYVTLLKVLLRTGSYAEKGAGVELQTFCCCCC